MPCPFDLLTVIALFCVKPLFLISLLFLQRCYFTTFLLSSLLGGVEVVEGRTDRAGGEKCCSTHMPG